MDSIFFHSRPKLLGGLANAGLGDLVALHGAIGMVNMPGHCVPRVLEPGELQAIPDQPTERETLESASACGVQPQLPAAVGCNPKFGTDIEAPSLRDVRRGSRALTSSPTANSAVHKNHRNPDFRTAGPPLAALVMSDIPGGAKPRSDRCQAVGDGPRERPHCTTISSISSSLLFVSGVCDSRRGVRWS